MGAKSFLYQTIKRQEIRNRKLTACNQFLLIKRWTPGLPNHLSAPPPPPWKTSPVPVSTVRPLKTANLLPPLNSSRKQSWANLPLTAQTGLELNDHWLTRLGSGWWFAKLLFHRPKQFAAYRRGHILIRSYGARMMCDPDNHKEKKVVSLFYFLLDSLWERDCVEYHILERMNEWMNVNTVWVETMTVLCVDEEWKVALESFTLLWPQENCYQTES